MNDNRRQVLEMLANGKITAEEAERLIAALERSGTHGAGATAMSEADKVKYLRVLVDTKDPLDGPTKVNVRVPMQLLRAGVRLSSLIPADARDEVNAAMKSYGMPIDIAQLKPENLEDLIDQLNDLTVDVDDDKSKVRVFAE